MQKAPNSTCPPPESSSESNLGSHLKGKCSVMIMLHPLCASHSHSPTPKAPDTMKPTEVIKCRHLILCNYITSLSSIIMSVKNMFLSVPLYHCCQLGLESHGITGTNLQDDILCISKPSSLLMMALLFSVMECIPLVRLCARCFLSAIAHPSSSSRGI